MASRTTRAAAGATDRVAAWPASEPELERPIAGGRICGEHGCTTVLSSYNATAFCGLHSRRDWRANREPRHRPASASHRVPAPRDDDDWGTAGPS